MTAIILYRVVGARDAYRTPCGLWVRGGGYPNDIRDNQQTFGARLYTLNINSLNINH